MCGILGYVGKGRSYEALLDGLLRLEYRGYDSCGLATINDNKLFLKKRSGKIGQLKKDLQEKLKSNVDLGILHTRWATHGKPNTTNAHPHYSRNNNIIVVHNGIIENFLSLKQELIRQGCRFKSETDSEVIAHLIDKCYTSNLRDAVREAVKKLQGSFALAVVTTKEPDELVAVRKASPLIVGIGKGENFIASDIPAVLPFTRRAIYLKDGEMAVLKSNQVQIYDDNNLEVRPIIETITIQIQDAQKKGYEHFMLKEIFQQPSVLSKIVSLYCKGQDVRFSHVGLGDDFLRKIKKIYIVACGTAYHAGYVAKYFLEKRCKIDIFIDTSSEFRYRQVHLDKNSLVISISQSGETADTLAAIKKAKKCGAKVLGVCNVLGSSLVKESHSVLATLAGPEIGVASTKAYTAQVFCLYLFALHLSRVRKDLSDIEFKKTLKEMRKVPALVKDVLKHSQSIKRIARTFSRFGSFLFLGRGINYPTALEGALKLKEISYIPAEGYAAGEMKHGPIALIDEYRGVVCIAPSDDLHGKMFSNIQEAKARKGKILAIVSEDDKEASALCYKTIRIPKTSETDINPILAAICLQLFAYFVAKNLGCEIDQPRNLAKSVTVE
jgi:glutamine---fructose-6-phosphate transaminase (isomerizing)